MPLIAIPFCLFPNAQSEEKFLRFFSIRERNLCSINTFLVVSSTAFFLNVAEFLLSRLLTCHVRIRKQSMHTREELLDNKATSHLHNMRLRVQHFKFNQHRDKQQISSVSVGFCAQFSYIESAWSLFAWRNFRKGTQTSRCKQKKKRLIEWKGEAFSVFRADEWAMTVVSMHFLHSWSFMLRTEFSLFRDAKFDDLSLLIGFRLMMGNAILESTVAKLHETCEMNFPLSTAQRPDQIILLLRWLMLYCCCLWFLSSVDVQIGVEVREKMLQTTSTHSPSTSNPLVTASLVTLWKFMH